MIEDDDEYKKPDVTEVVFTLIILGLGILLWFFLLVSISQP